MTSEVTVAVDLTATTNNRSQSVVVERPSWATAVSTYASASGWGSTTPAVVTIKHGPVSAPNFTAFPTPIEFSANGNIPDRYVADKPALRAEVTTAGVGGSFLDQDARITFVFTDRQEN